MKMIISPAKQMKTDSDSFSPETCPYFFEKSRELFDCLKNMSYEQLKKVWQCSDKLAGESFERLSLTDFSKNITPAIFAYDGIQYKYMAPSVMDFSALEYVKEHLFIISGLYGALKPFDGVVPYRLEMQSKGDFLSFKDLYSFWGGDIGNYISQTDDTVINLASKEYSKAVLPHLAKNIKVITCVFGQMKKGKITEQAPLVKMARGEMVRFAAVNSVKNPEDLKNFDGLSFEYSEELSDENNYIFMRKEK